MMSQNKIGERKKYRRRKRYLAAAFGIAGLSLAAPAPFPALADSPPFAYSEEKWASLRDNRLEFDEIADLIHEYNSTVKKNAIEYQDYKGKDSEEIAQGYYDTAQDIYDSIEYPDSDEENYGARLAAAHSSERSADQMMERGDENTDDSDTVLWGHMKKEKGLVQSAQQQMISYWNAVVSLQIRSSAAEKARKDLETAQTRAAAGTTSQTDVLNAREALLTAQAAVTETESSIASIKENLCLMLGWQYGDEVEISTLPEPEASMSARIHLEEDIAKAVENNYDLKTLNRQVKNARVGTVQRSYETTLKSSEEAVKSSVRSAWQSLLLSENQYAQAKESFALEEQSMQSAERKKAAGTISANAYQSQSYSYAAARAELDTAALSLLTAQLAYQWAVDGLASSV